MMVVGAAALFGAAAAQAEVDAKTARAFKTKCASCHGAAGKGDTDMGKKLKVPDFSTEAFQKGIKDDVIKSVIKDGKSGAKTIEDHQFGDKVKDQLDPLVQMVRTFAAK
jgi:mono/diheme cytochrome c family protein